MKRAKQEAMAYFNSPIAIKYDKTDEWGVKYNTKKQAVTSVKMGKSRPKIGKMHGAI